MSAKLKPFRAYLVFENSFSAFGAQRVLSSPLLGEFDFKCQLVPTPKEYSNNCTLALYIEGGWGLCAEREREFKDLLIMLLAQKHIKHDIMQL